MALAWCAICGSTHRRPKDCPGDLRATGPERHGWRVAVETPHGIEAYGILVAPSQDVWRARILTYPNVLWTIPRGESTIKFVGATAQAAEAKAVAFVEGHIRARGYLRRDGLDPVVAGRFRAESSRGAVAPAMRKLRSIPVRFGTGPSLFSAMTGNISESGLFVATFAPLDPGLAIRILVDLDVGALGLRGEVVWARRRMVLGRPTGMGVKLISPPAPYLEFVRELR
jgi:Tfp pilus assembly protein PilZ